MRTLLKLALRVAPRAAAAAADWIVYTIADTVFLWQTLGELQDQASEHVPAHPMPDTRIRDGALSPLATPTAPPAAAHLVPLRTGHPPRPFLITIGAEPTKIGQPIRCGPHDMPCPNPYGCLAMGCQRERAAGTDAA